MAQKTAWESLIGAEHWGQCMEISHKAFLPVRLRHRDVTSTTVGTEGRGVGMNRPFDFTIFNTLNTIRQPSALD